MKEVKSKNGARPVWQTTQQNALRVRARQSANPAKPRGAEGEKKILKKMNQRTIWQICKGTWARYRPAAYLANRQLIRQRARASRQTPQDLPASHQEQQGPSPVVAAETLPAIQLIPPLHRPSGAVPSLGVAAAHISHNILPLRLGDTSSPCPSSRPTGFSRRWRSYVCASAWLLASLEGLGIPCVRVLGACFGVEWSVVMGEEQFVLVGNVFVVASSSPDGIAVECGVGVGVMVVVGWGWDGVGWWGSGWWCMF